MSAPILLILFLTVFSFLEIVGGVPKGAANHNYDNKYNGYNSPPEFQYDPEYHSSTRELINYDVGLRDDNPSETTQNFANSSVNKIPKEIYDKYDELDIDEFIRQYVQGYEETPMADNRFGSDVQLRAGGTPRATPAGCKIETMSVPLINNADPDIFYIPRCTRIEQCSGCCGNRQITCQAIEKETVNVQVMTTTYAGGATLQYTGKKIIPLERHIKCKCDCSVLAEHCGPLQEYHQDECSCYCTNTDEQAKCLSEVKIKEWDDNTCTCKCRGLLECSSGSVYDHNECVCKRAS